MSSATIMQATQDPSLKAVITSRTPLMYADGANAAQDRPAHVRAASSLAWIHDFIAVVQDDANFVAMVDPATAQTRVVALPTGPGGLRQYDDIRGNKEFKFDLEACVAIDTAEGPKLLAFGSGSTPRRRQVLSVDQWRPNGARVSIANARPFYECLDADKDFAGSELNVEGAIVIGDVIRFFSRGNGAPHGDLLPVNATCDISLSVLLAFLQRPFSTYAPLPQNVVQYSLGTIDNVALGFTDATLLGNNVLYSAAAELSANATVDGPVAGSALGIIRGDGSVRYAHVTDANGNTLHEKVEGVLMAKGSSTHAYVVVDADDPERPSELCTVELSGAWSA